MYTFKGKLVHVNATANFAQIVKKATCLMTTVHSTIPTTISHLSLNELRSEKKKKKMDVLINIPTKAKEISMIQISFWPGDSNLRQAQSGIRVKNYS